MATAPPFSDDEPSLREGEVAILIERSVFTLRRARCDRPDLIVPPHEKIGGKVFYGERTVRSFIVQRGLGRKA
jgi:hypothetical protein